MDILTIMLRHYCRMNIRIQFEVKYAVNVKLEVAIEYPY